MTIVGAWVRRTKKGAEELMMVSDSRINGGGNIDSAPKVFLFPRTDCIIGFSGTTLIAYPLLTQISQSISFHTPLKDRVLDYSKLRTHLMRLINDLFKEYDVYDADLIKPDTSFLLGGYSWFRKRFCIDRIFFQPSQARFEHRPCGLDPNKPSGAFIGDWAKEVRKRVYGRVREERISHFDMEPFEVIRDLLRKSRDDDTIGGAPQIVSVSQHMNSRHTAVYWPTRDAQSVYLGGRKVRDFENLESWILDPDSLRKEHLYF